MLPPSKHASRLKFPEKFLATGKTANYGKRNRSVLRGSLLRETVSQRSQCVAETTLRRIDSAICQSISRRRQAHSVTLRVAPLTIARMRKVHSRSAYMGGTLLLHAAAPLGNEGRHLHRTNASPAGEMTPSFALRWPRVAFVFSFFFFSVRALRTKDEW